MSRDEAEAGREEETDLDESEMGEPVAELRELREPASARLGQRIFGSIRRRQLVSHVTDFSVLTPILVLLEYLESILSVLRPSPERTEENEG